MEPLEPRDHTLRKLCWGRPPGAHTEPGPMVPGRKAPSTRGQIWAHLLAEHSEPKRSRLNLRPCQPLFMTMKMIK